MSDKKMREAFESSGFIPLGCVLHDGKYGFWIVDDDEEGEKFTVGMGFVQAKWESFKAGWMASRESLVIELPRHEDPSYFDSIRATGVGYNSGIDECRKFIEAAGMKVQP